MWKETIAGWRKCQESRVKFVVGVRLKSVLLTILYVFNFLFGNLEYYKYFLMQ